MKIPNAALQPIQPRRRVIRLLAATSVVGLAAATGVLAGSPSGTDASLHHWRGVVLGADASLMIHHSDATEAVRLTTLALIEIERLEKIYSLNRPDSALVRLNREGLLNDPPAELVELLSRARTWSEISDGAFDVTVQPLWELYRDFFSDPASAPDGPSEAAVAKVRSLVDFRSLDVTPDRISLANPGMAVTLNGIAQGDITDRVAEMLRAEGLTQSLINLGEMRALGGHPEGRPWRVGVKDPYDSASLVTQTDLTDRAMATSSATGTIFDTSGRHHHLFDPKSGRPSRGLISATVIGRRAADADAFSTALLAAHEPLSTELGAHMGVDRVFTIHSEGTVRTWNARA
jgi:thiamine biosynthesis lipoprotein